MPANIYKMECLKRKAGYLLYEELQKFNFTRKPLMLIDILNKISLNVFKSVPFVV
jgi:hypothetical protein